MGWFNRVEKTPEERLAENTKLVGAEIAAVSNHLSHARPDGYENKTCPQGERDDTKSDVETLGPP